MADLNQTCGSTTEEEALSANLSKLQIEQAGTQRAEQTTLLVTLPIELLLQIFEALGPAGRRLLGSTCVKLYETYKEYYYEKKIVININEAANPRRPLLAGTRAYQDILSKWICPQSVMDEDAREDDAREMRNQARKTQTPWGRFEKPPKKNARMIEYTSRIKKLSEGILFARFHGSSMQVKSAGKALWEI